MENNEKLDN